MVRGGGGGGGVGWLFTKIQCFSEFILGKTLLYIKDRTNRYEMFMSNIVLAFSEIKLPDRSWIFFFKLFIFAYILSIWTEQRGGGVIG